MNKLYLIIFSLFYTTLTFAVPVVSHEYNYYKITGSTSAELRKEMSTYGPIIDGGRFDAKINWHINWYYHWTKYPNSCVITGVDIKIHITHVMPDWTNEQSTSAEVQHQWDTYIKNLTRHEQGHVDNGLRAALDIEEAVLQAPAMPDCSQLKRTLDDISYQIIKKHNDWDIDYDARTKHGRTQGAAYP